MMAYYERIPEPRGDTEKLPKWARGYIESLKHKVDEQRDHIEAISTKHPGTNVVISGSAVHPDRHIEPGSEIDFYMTEDRTRYQNTISVKHRRTDPSTLQLMASGGRLIVLPESTNLIHVRIEKL